MMGERDAQEDPRLTLARERLQGFRGIFCWLSQTEKAAVLSYDGPEVSGSMKSRRVRKHDGEHDG